MSQPRMLKACAPEVSRVRSSLVKASGDSSLQPNRQQHPRSRSKNKIPKNIRYDLDNALVGLCDVWFEDIKPHLIRNNIKVHIHGDGASPASGDHQRLPAGAPGCSHYDPGAASDHRQHPCVNFAGCYSTPPTASRAPCRRPPAPASPVSPVQLILQTLKAQRDNKITNEHVNKRSEKKPVIQSACQRWRSQARLSRTYTVPTRNPRSISAPCRTLNKGSQTHFRISYNPNTIMIDQGTQTIRPRRRQTSARTALNVPAASFDRCPGKTTLIPTRLKSTPQSPSPLFSDSLIKDIKETNVIKVLYHSPNSSKFNSSVTLLETPKGKRKRKDAGKIPPWR